VGIKKEEGEKEEEEEEEYIVLVGIEKEKCEEGLLGFETGEVFEILLIFLDDKGEVVGEVLFLFFETSLPLAEKEVEGKGVVLTLEKGEFLFKNFGNG
jgi:hypothetical protein